MYYEFTTYLENIFFEIKKGNAIVLNGKKYSVKEGVYSVDKFIQELTTLISPDGFSVAFDSNKLTFRHKNTEFKEYNSRSPDFFTDHIPVKAPELDRKVCAKFPLVPVFDFEIQKIRHCSRKVINGSRQFDVTKENIDKMMNYKLFDFEKYCEKCFDIIPKRPTAQRNRIIEILKEEELQKLQVINQ